MKEPKTIWNNLQDLNNKRKIICNATPFFWELVDKERFSTMGLLGVSGMRGWGRHP